MKSKVSVHQQLHSVLQILNVASVIVIVMFVLSVISLAQTRLPFIGTRTFCGEDPGTTAIVSIRNDRFTTVKTNMYNGAWWGGGKTATYRYETFTGKLNARGELMRDRDSVLLEIKSGTNIRIFTNQDWMEGKLCTSNDVLPKESKDVQPTLTTTPKITSTQIYTEVSFEEAKDLEGLLKSFPILKIELEDVIDINKDEEFEKTQVYVSDLNQKDMPRLLFVAMNGISCGAALCSLTVYIDQGQGFTDLLHALTMFGAPVYISKDQSSLLTCGKDGRGEWRFKNNVFEPVAGKFRTTQNLAPCSVRRFGQR